MGVKSHAALAETPTEPSNAVDGPSRPKAFASAEPMMRSPETGELAGNVLEPGADSA